jgi:hypothetical protein
MSYWNIANPVISVLINQRSVGTPRIRNMQTKWRHIRSFACPPCSHGTTAVSPYQENNLLLSGCLSCWQRVIVTITREKERAEGRVTARFIWHLLFVLCVSRINAIAATEKMPQGLQDGNTLCIYYTPNKVHFQTLRYCIIFRRYIFLLVPGYLMTVYKTCILSSTELHICEDLTAEYVEGGVHKAVCWIFWLHRRKYLENRNINRNGILIICLFFNYYKAD